MTFVINDHETSPSARRRLAALRATVPTPTETALDQRARVVFTEALSWFTDGMSDEEARRLYAEALDDSVLACLHGYAYGHMHGVQHATQEPGAPAEQPNGVCKTSPPTWPETALSVVCLLLAVYAGGMMIGWW